MSRLDWLIRLCVGFSSEGLDSVRYRGGDARGSSRRIIVTGAHYSNLPRSIYLSFTSREDVSCVTMSAARNPPACIIHSFILKLHEGHTAACARKWKRILSLASATARQSRTTADRRPCFHLQIYLTFRRSLPKSFAERTNVEFDSRIHYIYFAEREDRKIITGWDIDINISWHVFLFLTKMSLWNIKK